MTAETGLMVRASWPSTICPANGLHHWLEARSVLICGWCGQKITYADCDAYQHWSMYWLGLVTAGVVARSN